MVMFDFSLACPDEVSLGTDLEAQDGRKSNRNGEKILPERPQFESKLDPDGLWSPIWGRTRSQTRIP